MFTIGLTDHLEGPADRPSAEIFAEIAEITRLADSLGVAYSWFAEHHAHVHRGHLPTPLLLALHLAGQTKQIRLGMAITCLNLHGALETAEQVAVADTLISDRLAPGFGSGSSPIEAAWMGAIDPLTEAERHQRFEWALGVMRSAWEEGVGLVPGPFLPKPSTDLRKRSWIAVNSVGAASIAGRFGGNMLFSHLRIPRQHAEYTAAYHAAGGTGLIAMNRPVYVGKSDAQSLADAEPALRLLWRRFRDEGKIPAGIPEPIRAIELCDHPINFIVGSPQTVIRQLNLLHQLCPFAVANLELRWDGLTHDQVLKSLGRLMSAMR